MTITKSEQIQTILNLYDSGIPIEIISLQMDMGQIEVESIISQKVEEMERKKSLARAVSNTPALGAFYLDAVVDLKSFIKNAEMRMWKALKSELEFNISMQETREILGRFAKSRVDLVILHVDLIGSTKLSMTLPLDRFTTIVQSFIQEMSLIISQYGGYVLKYIGDAVLGFFTLVGQGSERDGKSANDSPNAYQLPCINAISCAKSMIKVLNEGINPILNQYDYPEISVRIGIDVGETAVLQYGWDIHQLNGNREIREPHYDIMGYTLNMTVKMSGFAKSNSIVIGQSVYQILNDVKKKSFEIIETTKGTWSYMDEKTGDVYRIYGSLSDRSDFS